MMLNEGQNQNRNLPISNTDAGGQDQDGIYKYVNNQFKLKTFKTLQGNVLSNIIQCCVFVFFFPFFKWIEGPSIVQNWLIISRLALRELDVIFSHFSSQKFVMKSKYVNNVQQVASGLAQSAILSFLLSLLQSHLKQSPR